MPVFMVRVDAATLAQQQVWCTDLRKLYAEEMEGSLPAEGSLPSAADFITAAMQVEANWFAAALFNDHLLGAVLVEPSASGWSLSCLRVRKVTRRRGVAKRLLHLLSQAAAKQKQRLDWSKISQNPAVIAHLSKDDF